MNLPEALESSPALGTTGGLNLKGTLWSISEEGWTGSALELQLLDHFFPSPQGDSASSALIHTNRKKTSSPNIRKEKTIGGPEKPFGILFS